MEEYRRKMALRRKEWANGFDYHDQWGDTYGFDLADPYTEEEIVHFEDVYDCALPPGFRNYLVRVSREYMKDTSFPAKIELCVDGSCVIPKETRTVCRTSTQGMIRFATKDETYEICDYIVVKGNHVGSIWTNDSDFLHKTDTTDASLFGNGEDPPDDNEIEKNKKVDLNQGVTLSEWDMKWCRCETGFATCAT